MAYNFSDAAYALGNDDAKQTKEAFFHKFILKAPKDTGLMAKAIQVGMPSGTVVVIKMENKTFAITATMPVPKSKIDSVKDVSVGIHIEQSYALTVEGMNMFDMQVRSLSKNLLLSAKMYETK